MQQAADPVEVLLPERPVEAVLRACRKAIFCEVDRLALALQLGDVGREVVARRQLDDREDDDADRDQRRDHDQDPVDDVAEHRAPAQFAAGTATVPAGVIAACSLGREPEAVRLVDAEIARRGPSCRCPPRARCAACCCTTTGCGTPATSADREHLVGVDLRASRCQILRALVVRRRRRARRVELHAARSPSGMSGASPALPLVSTYWPHFGHCSCCWRGRRELAGAHVGGGEAVLDALADRHHRLAGEDAVAEDVELRRLGEELDADLAPGIADQLEHVGLLGRTRRNSRR